jgi:hypothetical protein
MNSVNKKGWITKKFGENYLTCALIAGAIIYKKFKNNEEIVPLKIINHIIKKHNFKLTDKGKKSLVETIKNTISDARLQEKQTEKNRISRTS